MKRELFYQALSSLEIAIEERVESLLFGRHQSRRLGRVGLEFYERIPASDTTPVSSIDWRLFFQTGRWMERRYRVERELPVMVVLDYSEDMQYGNRFLRKQDLALIAAGTFWQSARRYNDRVGVVPFHGSVAAADYILEPSRSVDVDFLLNIEEYLDVTAGKALTEALVEVNALMASPGLVIVVSDCWMDDPDWDHALVDVLNQHDVAVVRVIDARERDPFSNGVWSLRDTMTGAYLEADGASTAQQASYRRAFDAHEEELRDVVEEIGGSFVDLTLVAPHDDDTHLTYSHRVVSDAANRLLVGTEA